MKKFSVVLLAVLSLSSFARAADFTCSFGKDDNSNVIRVLAKISSSRVQLEQAMKELGIGELPITMLINCSNDNSSNLNFKQLRASVIEKMSDSSLIAK